MLKETAWRNKKFTVMWRVSIVHMMPCISRDWFPGRMLMNSSWRLHGIFHVELLIPLSPYQARSHTLNIPQIPALLSTAEHNYPGFLLYFWAIFTATAGQQLTRLLFVLLQRAPVLPTVTTAFALDYLKPIIIPDPCTAPDSAAACSNNLAAFHSGCASKPQSRTTITPSSY